MSQNLQIFAKCQEFQLDNLVDFEKCCKTHIFLQKSEPIQPKTSNILPKFCRSAVVSPTEAEVAGAASGFGSGRCRGASPSTARPSTRRARSAGNCQFLAEFRQNVVRFRLYRLRFLQENTSFAAFFKIYQIIKLIFLKFGKSLQILRHLQFFC